MSKQRTREEQYNNINQFNNSFTYHAPKEGQPEKYEQIRKTAREFAFMLNQLCPECQEFHEAVKKIEEAVFWANASIARHE